MKTVNKPRLSSNSALAEGRIASVATAIPPYTIDQMQSEAFLTKYYSKELSPRSQAIMHKVFAHPSVLRRHFAIEDTKCLINEDPDSRVARFTHWAVELFIASHC